MIPVEDRALAQRFLAHLDSTDAPEAVRDLPDVERVSLAAELARVTRIAGWTPPRLER